MSADLWLMLLVVAVNALMFHALRRLSRPDILFSVTVPGALRRAAKPQPLCVGIARSSGSPRSCQ